MRKRLTILLALALFAAPFTQAQAFDLEQALRDVRAQVEKDVRPDHRATQGGCKSLSDAIAEVRRKTDGRIVSAETKRNNGREVHHIKVLTKDGKVKTHRVQGCKRDNG